MSFRTTATLLVMALLLTGYAVFFESENPSGLEGPGRVFPGLEPSDIVKLEIEYGGEDAAIRLGANSASITLERRGEHDWQITSPLEFAGFIPRIQGLTWSIVDLVQVAEVKPTSQAYAAAIPPTGPELTVRFQTRQGWESSIEIGRDYPEASMDYLYIRVIRAPRMTSQGSQAVHVTKKSFRTNFSVGLEELRSRALFPIPPIDLIELTVVARNDPEKLDKKLVRSSESSEWVFRGHPELDGTLADRTKVGEFLVALNAWKIEFFENDAAQDFSPYGLDVPEFQLRGVHDDGNEVVIDVGSEFTRQEKKLVYVRKPGQSFVFAAEADLVEHLREESEALRTRHVFDFQGAEIVKIACDGPQSSFVLERRREESGGKSGPGNGPSSARDSWVVGRPGEEDARPGDRHLIGVSTVELREKMIQSFLPRLASGADMSAFDKSVTVTLDTGTTVKLRLAERSDDPRDKDLDVYRGVRSTDGCQFFIETSWPQRIEQGEYVFRDRAISRLEPTRVYEVELTAGDSRWRLRRLPGHDWTFADGDDVLPGKELDTRVLNDILRDLGRERFRPLAFAPKISKKDYDHWGIGRSKYRQKLSLTEVDRDGGLADSFKNLFIGHKKPDAEPETYYARVDSYDVPFLLTKSLPDLFDRLFDHLRDTTGKP